MIYLLNKLLLIFLILFLNLDAKSISRTQVIMSTYITINLDVKDEKYIEKGFDIFKDVEKSLSSYDKNAKIYKLNHSLHVELDDYTYEALQLSKKYYKDTNGYFDVTIGSITKDLYRFGESQRVPNFDELTNAKLSMNSLHVEPRFAKIIKGMKVDLGGMGKGFGVDKVVEFYKQDGVKKGVISASGDIRCLSTCRVDVQNPFSNTSLVSFKTAKDNLGVSTSGNYERFVKSKKNNHLINPKKKQSQVNFISITLIGGPSSADLDAYTTAASVMPNDRAYEFLNSLGVGYIVLDSDKKLFISENIETYVKDLVINYAVKK